MVSSLKIWKHPLEQWSLAGQPSLIRVFEWDVTRIVEMLIRYKFNISMVCRKLFGTFHKIFLELHSKTVLLRAAEQLK